MGEARVKKRPTARQIFGHLDFRSESNSRMSYYVEESSDNESESSSALCNFDQFDRNFFNRSNPITALNGSGAGVGASSGPFQLVESPQMPNMDIGQAIANAPRRTKVTDTSAEVSFSGFGLNVSAGPKYSTKADESEVDPNALNAMKEMFKDSLDGYKCSYAEAQKVITITVLQL